MIVDIFLGFNEIRLAEFRLDYLSRNIDHTIIGESRLTHSGISKELYFAKWYTELDSLLQSKVTVLEIPLDNFTGSWEREIFSREYLVNYAKKEFPGSKFILSDLDEIPSNNQVENMLGTSGVFHFVTPTYYRRANWRLKDKHLNWSRGVCGDIDQLQEENGGRFASFPLIPGKPGIHLSYLGMTDVGLRQKISSFAHTELAVTRFAAPGLVKFCDLYRINHLGQSRTKGFGLFEIEQSHADDLWNLRLMKFSDLMDLSNAQIPSFPRRIWASALVSAYLNRKTGADSDEPNQSFESEISSALFTFLATKEILISLAYFFKRSFRDLVDRLRK